MLTSQDRAEDCLQDGKGTAGPRMNEKPVSRVPFVLSRAICVALLFVVWASPVFAENHALLIGINRYQSADVSPLQGPVNDVAALKETLLKYGFSPPNVTTLVNSQATKEGILGAFRKLKAVTKPGDFIFAYFSGHGTSAYAPETNDEGVRQAYGVEIGESSGALVPYDAKISRDPTATLKSLIVGRRDLKPLLLDLDKDRKLFVAFDSCFSGNTIRAVRKSGLRKFVDVFGGMPSPVFQGSKKEPYPYKNVIYLSAAKENEAATDETDPSLTIDKKEHGVLTDALLRGLRGEADTNHDGVITYLELYEYVKRRISIRNYTLSQAQTPQLLPLSEDVKDISLASPVFGFTGHLPSGGNERPRPPDSVLRVRLEGDQTASPLPSLLSPLLCRGAKKGCIEIVKDEYDLLIQDRSKTVGYPVLFPSGDTLYTAEKVADLKALLERFVKVKEIIGFSNPDQTFNVRVSANEGRTLFFDGEVMSVRIETERDAWLVVLNIDPENYIGIHRPDKNVESSFVRKNLPLRLASGRISPPLGCEFMKVIAFLDKKDAERFVGLAAGIADGYIDPGGEQFLRFREALESSTRDRSGWAEAIIQVVTRAR